MVRGYPVMSQLSQLLNQGKTYFQAKNYEACVNSMNDVLSEEPSNAEAVWLMKEAQRQWEDQRSMEELEIYVENVKKEAMDLFDEGQYEQCLGMFRFLLELDPKNHMLRDYLKLSQQMFLETIETGTPASEAGSISIPERALGKGTAALPLNTTSVSPPPPVRELPPTAVLAPSEEPREVHDAASSPEVKKAQPTPLAGSARETLSQTEKQRIIEEYLALAAHAQRKRRRIFWLTTSTLLGVVILGAYLWLYPSITLTNSLDIQSNPERARVFINNQLKGQTHFHQESIPPGSYRLRIEKEGYAPYSQKLDLGKRQAALILVQLQKLRDGSELTNQSVAPVFPEPQPPVQPNAPVSSEPEPKSIPEEIAYSVIHHHVLGSCTGRLKINGELISFRPSGDSKDGFARKIGQINHAELGDKLTLRFKEKTYRFEALARNNEENHQRLSALYQQIRKMGRAGAFEPPAL